MEEELKVEVEEVEEVEGEGEERHAKRKGKHGSAKKEARDDGSKRIVEEKAQEGKRKKKKVVETSSEPSEEEDNDEEDNEEVEARPESLSSEELEKLKGAVDERKKLIQEFVEKYEVALGKGKGRKLYAYKVMMAKALMGRPYGTIPRKTVPRAEATSAMDFAVLWDFKVS
ncbi:Transmembrane channel-like protein 2 [Liparis tanakae]|uniref:Transmembrane channel-like protein 2 n=1 Tax=Liparis tanakae TaxID=230148 RepID=A0A4Z2J8T0_9TELE|nr:Transmembrane channel-like protein 2 [Liparis tanakae]